MVPSGDEWILTHDILMDFFFFFFFLSNTTGKGFPLRIRIERVEGKSLRILPNS
jgi:hypothetical protein